MQYLALEYNADTIKALIYSGWKTEAEANSMSGSDRRNTLIVKLNQNTAHSIHGLQQMLSKGSLKTLVGLTYITTFIKSKRIKTTTWRESNFYEEQRNALIDAINNRGFFDLSYLQSLGDVELYNAGVQAFGALFLIKQLIIHF